MKIEAIVKCSCGFKICESKKWIVRLERRGDRLVWIDAHEIASQEEIENLPFLGEINMDTVQQVGFIPYEELPLGEPQ